MLIDQKNRRALCKGKKVWKVNELVLFLFHSLSSFSFSFFLSCGVDILTRQKCRYEKLIKETRIYYRPDWYTWPLPTHRVCVWFAREDIKFTAFSLPWLTTSAKVREISGSTSTAAIRHYDFVVDTRAKLQQETYTYFAICQCQRLLAESNIDRWSEYFFLKKRVHDILQIILLLTMSY